MLGEALQLPLDVVSLSEIKPAAVKFLKYRWRSVLETSNAHIFDGNQILVEGHGRCHLHGTSCAVPAVP